MKFKSFNVAELTAKRAQLVSLKEEIAFLQATVKVEREFEREARARYASLFSLILAINFALFTVI